MSGHRTQGQALIMALKARRFCLTFVSVLLNAERLRESDMKSTLTITSKGQVTFRKEVPDQLGVRPGDKISVELVGPGRVEVRPVKPAATLEGFIGCLKQVGTPTLSVDEIMNFARDGWAGKR